MLCVSGICINVFWTLCADVCIFSHLVILRRFFFRLDEVLSFIFFNLCSFSPMNGFVVLVALVLTIQDVSSRRTGYSSVDFSSDESQRPSIPLSYPPPSRHLIDIDDSYDLFIDSTTFPPSYTLHLLLLPSFITCFVSPPLPVHRSVMSLYILLLGSENIFLGTSFLERQ